MLKYQIRLDRTVEQTKISLQHGTYQGAHVAWGDIDTPTERGLLTLVEREGEIGSVAARLKRDGDEQVRIITMPFRDLHLRGHGNPEPVT